MFSTRGEDEALTLRSGRPVARVDNRPAAQAIAKSGLRSQAGFDRPIAATDIQHDGESEKPTAPKQKITMACQRFDGPRAVSAARRYARDTLGGTIAEDVLDDVLLCLSELATNALRHAHADEFLVKLWAGPGRVRVECHDRASAWPRLRRPGGEETCGRGLMLVDSMTSRWGVTRGRLSRTKCVWFEIDVEPPKPSASPIRLVKGRSA
jgi:anti-sigma regulatory factor (Ser/Thr protein kinase)